MDYHPESTSKPIVDRTAQKQRRGTIRTSVTLQIRDDNIITVRSLPGSNSSIPGTEKHLL